MNEITLAVDDGGQRIDSYISLSLKDVSRNSAQKLISGGNITVNGQPVKSNYRLKTGDKIIVSIPELEPLDIEAEPLDIDIVYEDDDVAVINKPQGMVVHPAPGHNSGTLVNGLMYRLSSLSGINGVLRPGIVHRIDKNTSGLLIVAKNDKAHNYLARCLKDHSIYRVYNALVEGNLREDSGTIDAPIGRSEKDRKKYTVTNKNSKEAVTNFTVVERFGDYTLLWLRLKTGRTHQIRVHMKYIGHPVVGDDVYGSSRNEFGLKGQLLHSKTLGFIHPSTEKYLEFDTELPDYFQKVLDRLRAKKKI